MSGEAVTAVVLSWNDEESLRGCLDSLARSRWPRLSVLVVDNASERYDARAVCAGRKGVNVIVNPENFGVAGGRNVALDRLLGDPQTRFILFLDDDTEQDPDAIGRLVEAWDPEHGRAVVGPAIYEMARPSKLWSFGGRWNPWTGRSSHVVRRPAGPADAGDAGGPFAVDFIIGCCMLSHRSVFETVGRFDDAFRPYYGEDIDFCLRAAAKGLGSACTPSAVVRHRVSHAAGGSRYNPAYAFNKGEKTVLLMKRHAATRHWISFWPVQGALIAGAAVREGLRGNLSAVAQLVRGMTRPLVARRGGPPA